MCHLISSISMVCCLPTSLTCDIMLKGFLISSIPSSIKGPRCYVVYGRIFLMFSLWFRSDISLISQKEERFPYRATIVKVKQMQNTETNCIFFTPSEHLCRILICNSYSMSRKKELLKAFSVQLRGSIKHADILVML